MKDKLWFSILSKDAKYFSDEDNFLSPEKFEWTKNSQEIAHKIKEELLNYLKTHNLQSYFNTKMSDDVKKWKTLSLRWWGLQMYSHQRKFPYTTAFIDTIPDLISASFSLLEPHTKILPHCGDTNGIYRCHLGIVVPDGLPKCGFRVGDEKREWKEGEWLIFIDAKEHEAWNDTDHNRYILLIDIIRPEFIKHRNKIILTALTGLFLQRVAEKIPILYKFHKHLWLKNTIVYILLPLCYITSKIRNTLSKLKIVS